MAKVKDGGIKEKVELFQWLSILECPITRMPKPLWVGNPEWSFSTEIEEIPDISCGSVEENGRLNWIASS